MKPKKQLECSSNIQKSQLMREVKDEHPHPVKVEWVAVSYVEEANAARSP